jgi:hypothetical protein
MTFPVKHSAGPENELGRTFFLQPPKWILYQVGVVPQVTSRPPEAVEAGCLSRIYSL